MAYALVAGGSKGIGYGIALALAKRNYDLILIGRNEETLLSAKSSIENKYPVKVTILIKDLSKREAADEISDFVNSNSLLPLKVVCNVAGLGGSEDYLKLPLEKCRYMVHLNVESDMALCYTLLPILKSSAPSYILNVGSMAGFVPIPSKNLYAATKSATIFFSYSLYYQLKKNKISVSCLCPGPVFTKEEIKKDTIEKLGWFGKLMEVNPTRVGEIAVRRTLNGRLIIVPGIIAGCTSVILRTLPRRFVVFIYHLLGKKSE
jgi:short-subunit dehydrogenase